MISRDVYSYETGRDSSVKAISQSPAAFNLPALLQTHFPGAVSTGAVPKQKTVKKRQTKVQTVTEQNQNENKKKGFVAQWPAGKSYKQGSGLSRELNAHFAGFCFRCGHASHVSKDCRIYPSRTPIMNICQTCYQGFHEKCKSRKYCIPNQQNKGDPHSMEQQRAVVNAIQELFQQRWPVPQAQNFELEE